ncbi:MAG: hypothetical protein Q8L98_07950 [Chlamydiales bacterium]|nr:hypothetical protein [Chlamydiales bacterium]
MKIINNSCDATFLNSKESTPSQATWKDLSKICRYAAGGAVIAVAAGSLYFYPNATISEGSSIAQTHLRALDVTEDSANHPLMSLGQAVSGVALVTLHGLSTLGLLGVGFLVGNKGQYVAEKSFEMDVSNMDLSVRKRDDSKQLEVCEIAPQMNKQLTRFLKNYQSEIEQIYHELENAIKQVPSRGKSIEDAKQRQGRLQPLLEKISVGKWEILGAGVAKIVMTHPRIKKYVFKFSTEDPALSNSVSDSDQKTLRDLRFHFEKSQRIRELIEENQYKHLTVPDVYLVETSKGPFIVEEKLRFLKPLELILDTTDDKFDGPQEELEDLSAKANLCDVAISGLPHNAGFVQTSDGEISKVALYDFDCEVFYENSPQCRSYPEGYEPMNWCEDREKPPTHCEDWAMPKEIIDDEPPMLERFFSLFSRDG